MTYPLNIEHNWKKWHSDNTLIHSSHQKQKSNRNHSNTGSKLYYNITMQTITYYRSCCHSNVCTINDDSKSHRSIPITRRVILYPIYVHCGQSVRDNKSHIHQYVAGRLCVTILLTSSQLFLIWHSRRHTYLPRGLGLSPVSKDVIGLASCFGSISLKCQPTNVNGI